jgi:hypothetical protein
MLAIRTATLCGLLAGSVLMSSQVSPAAETFPPVAELPAHTNLPDPLVGLRGEKIETVEQWRSVRRPELVRLFEHYMYGAAPPPPRNLRVTVQHEDPGLFDGRATLRLLELRFGPDQTPPIHLLLAFPNQRPTG